MSSGGLPVIGGSGGIPIVGTVNGVAVTGTPSSGQVLTATSSTAADWQSPSAGTPAFSAITSGTNTGMAGVIGTGASLTVSGSGTNNATAIDGVTVTGTPTAGQAPVATSGTAASWQAITANAVNAVPLPNIARSWYYQFTGASGTTTGSGVQGGLYMVVTNGNTIAISSAFGEYCGAYNGAGANTVCGFLSSAQFYAGHSLTMTSFNCWYNTNTADASWNWLGFTDQTLATMVAGINPAGNYACFRYAGGTDTNFQCITKDGTTQTVIDSGVKPSAGFLAASSGLLFQIVCNDSVPNVQFYIGGTLVATSTTHLPTSGTALQFVFGGKSSSAIGIGFSVSYIYITATI
jgi:hypothetical protein